VSVRARIRALRVPLTIAAATVFVGGAIWSFFRMDLSLSELHLSALALLAALALASFVYGGVGLALLAITVGTSIPLRKAIPIAVYASLAEVLPLPGGAIVRTGALVSSGARVGQSSLVVIVTAILWISIAATGAGLYLVYVGEISGLVLVIPAVLAVAGVLVWLLVKAGWKITILTLGHRLTGLLLVSLRLKLSFMVLGVTLSLENTLPFAFAGIAGSASAIAPAGLGIGESLSALLATVAATAPTAAFLAAALNRTTGLVVAAIAAPIAQFGIRINARHDLKNGETPSATCIEKGT